MRRILVTGSDGQLAHEISLESRNIHDHKFIFTSKEDLDITNEKKLIKYFDNEKFDIVINCAAYTAVDNSEKYPSIAYKVNHLSVETLSNLALLYDYSLIHFSSDYVFNGQKKSPYNEEDDTTPLGAYGRSKLQGEEAIIRISPRGMIIRTSWLYSTYKKNFFNTILDLCNLKKEIKVVNDQIGTPTYAADLASILLKIIISDKFYKVLESLEIFHLTNEGQCSWFEFASKIVSFCNLDCRVLPCSTEEFTTLCNRPSYSVLSNEKIKKAFGLPLPIWEDSLKRCIGNLNN